MTDTHSIPPLGILVRAGTSAEKASSARTESTTRNWFWDLVLHTALQGECELAMFGRFRTRPCRRAGCYCRYFAACFFQSTQTRSFKAPEGKDLFKNALIRKQKKRRKKKKKRRKPGCERIRGWVGGGGGT